MKASKLILGSILLTLTCCLTLLSETESQHAIQNYSVTIANNPPTIGTPTCCIEDQCGTSYTPRQAADYSITCYATANDPNGYLDISQYGNGRLTFYKNDSEETGTEDQDIRYTKSHCTFSNGNGQALTVNCTISGIKYYADAGEWIAKIYVTDGISKPAYSTMTLTINSQVAIDQTPTLDFGTMDIGSAGSSSRLGYNNVQAITKNTGNVNINLTITAPASMKCSVAGNMGIGNITFDTAENTTYPGKCHLQQGTITPRECQYLGLNIPDQEDPAGNYTATTYWGIAIPDGVSGTCWADTTFNAIQA
ncbi:Uncharacterised protein [uncultured archaeon]|nr:Uncharacterised protein [uncultured archaeon]